MSISIINQIEKNNSNKNLNFETLNCSIDLFLLAKIRIELYDVTIIKDFKLNEISPYLTIYQGEESIKTTIGRKKNSHSYQFNEVLEIKKSSEPKLSVRLYHKTNFFSRDQMLGKTTIELNKIGNMDFSQVPIFDNINDMIAIMNIKIILKDSNDVNLRLQTESVANARYRSGSSRGSADLTQGIISKTMSNQVYESNNNFIFIQKEDSILHNQSSSKNVNHIIQRQIDYQNSMKKGSGSEDLDFLSTQTETLKFDDIEKIKADLYEEKNKMRMEEIKLNKLGRMLKIQESQIESDKKTLQKRKDYLTEQELLLLEEKRKLDTAYSEIHERQLGFSNQKDGILTEYDIIHQTLTILKSKNNILIRKMHNYEFKVDEMRARQKYLEETLINAEKKKPRSKSFEFFTNIACEDDPCSPYMNHNNDGSEIINDEACYLEEIRYSNQKGAELEYKLDELTKLENELIERIKEKEEKNKQNKMAMTPPQSNRIAYTPTRDIKSSNSKDSYGYLDSGMMYGSRGTYNMNISYTSSPVQNSIDYGQLLQKSSLSKL